MVNEIESKRTQTLKHKARRESIKEGIFSSASFSMGNRFISPFAIALNASNSLVAMLNSMTGLLGPLSQYFGSKAIEKNSRKKVIVRSLILETLMWIPILIIGVLFLFGIAINILPLTLLIFFSFFTIFGNYAFPAWFSWVGDIVEDKYKGAWFSKREVITSFVSIILAIGSSFMLDYFKNKNLTIIGFIILFSLAFTCRIFSIKSFKRKYEPKLYFKKGNHFSFKDFLKSLHKTNFGRFTIFKALFLFSISISSPLVVIYLLRYLNFEYITYILITISGTFFSMIFIGVWGKIIDIYGSYRVIIITTLIIPLVPILWIISSNVIYLIFIPSAIMGIMWAGFLLGARNFIYDNVSSQKRGLAVSYLNVLMGIGIFLGAGLGALLIKYWKINLIPPLFAIFIVGSLARMLIVYVFLSKFKEIKEKEEFKGFRSLKQILYHVKPTIIEEAHQIMSIKKYLRK